MNDCPHDDAYFRAKVAKLKVAAAASLVSAIAILSSSQRAAAQYMGDSSGPTACVNAHSNTDTGLCFQRMSEEADRKLNQVYNEIQHELEAEHRQKVADYLRIAQKRWIAFRDANCDAAQEMYKGGTAGPVNGAACVEATTRHRTEELEMEYGIFLQWGGFAK
jgi:uncharacterized protein YecT (DUF1311 family)